MMPSILAPATGRLELPSTEMGKAVGGDSLGEGHQEFCFGCAESSALTWYLNKVSPLDEVIKGLSIDRKEKRVGDPAWGPTSIKRLERR